MSDNIVSGNKFAFGDPLSASVGVNFNLTVTMPDAYALSGKWATLTVSKFEDGPELFKLSEAGGGLTFSGQNIPVTINNDATNETAGGDTWHTLIENYRNLRFSLDVGDDTDTSNAEYRFQGTISTDPRRGVLPTGLEIGETVTPTLGGTTINVSLLGHQALSASGSSGVNAGDDTDVHGLLQGDGATLSAATAAQVRAAADLDTTDSPTFDSLTLTGEITQGGNAVLDESYFTPQTLTDGATISYDVSNGVNAKVTLGGDRTLAAIANAAEGQSGSLTVIQDATGGRALSLDASQTDMLGTLADIAGMGANDECEIAWRKTDYTNCKLWITIPA